MKVFIAKGDLVDASEILALQKLAYQSEARLYDDWSLPPLMQTLDEIEAEFAQKVVLKAVLTGTIIGSVRASLSDGICHIGRLIVHPDHQKKGVGTRLMRAIEAAFPEAKRYELFTGSKSLENIRLYQTLGYQRHHEETLSPSVILIFMHKHR